jgi:hypothetical protein
MIAECAVHYQQFTACAQQVNGLVGAVSALQSSTHTMHSGPAASAGVEGVSTGAAAGATGPLWPNGGWGPARPAGGIPATARTFGGTEGDGGNGGGGHGGPTGGGPTGGGGLGGTGGFGGRWSLYDEKYVLSGKGT